MVAFLTWRGTSSALLVSLPLLLLLVVAASQGGMADTTVKGNDSQQDQPTPFGNDPETSPTSKGGASRPRRSEPVKKLGALFDAASKGSSKTGDGRHAFRLSGNADFGNSKAGYDVGGGGGNVKSSSFGYSKGTSYGGQYSHPRLPHAGGSDGFILPSPVEASSEDFLPPSTSDDTGSSVSHPFLPEDIRKMLFGERDTTATEPGESSGRPGGSRGRPGGPRGRPGGPRGRPGGSRGKPGGSRRRPGESSKESSVEVFTKGGTKKRPPSKAECSRDNVPKPVNGYTKCSTYAGCRASCNDLYKFPNGDRRLFLECDQGQWVVTSTKWDTLPDCEPICRPPCQNNGICLSPDQCFCPDNWEGDRCQVPKRTKCANKPPTPSNSNIMCNSTDCIARCLQGYHFQEGATRLTFQCEDGSWVVRPPAPTPTTPDCQPICEPVCGNGGKCIGPDVCQCTREYRGDRCQYPISNCDPKNLPFNGGYNCSGKGMVFGCSVHCPEGVDFTFTAAEVYNCDYATGTWSPSPIPTCDYGFFEVTPPAIARTTGTYPPGFEDLFPTHKPIIKQPGFCFTWAGTHYKSFDGKVYSFESSCPYTLVQDAAHGTFSVNLRPTVGCEGSSCPRTIDIFYENDEYVLQTTKSGQPSLAYRETNLAIPGQMNGIVSERVAHFVVVKVAGLGLTLKWDMKNLVVTEISELLWNRTSGLCGRRDGSQENDWSYADGTTETNMNSFLQAWQAKTLGEQCLQQPKTKHPCDDHPEAYKADDFCARLRNDIKFAQCRQVVDVEPYVNTCRWDYCDNDDQEQYACESFAAFFRECTSAGVDMPEGWRSPELCPMECGTGKVFNPCMSAIQPRCGQPADSVRPDFCVEGCDCPSGLVLHQGLCIPAQDCPCKFHNKDYRAGDTIPNDCNSCTCQGGEWVCTEVKCGSRCSAVGDPHYTTFDGRHFDFMGKCSYYLVQGQNFSIEAENVPCGSGFTEDMNLPNSVVSQFPSCTKSVTVSLGGTVIHLKQDRQVTVNGVDQEVLPTSVGEAYIKAASSLFVIVELSNGLDVWWDGQTRVYIDAPAEFRGKTAGLCGTFTDNQRDDFLTPEGDIEQNAIPFANKWKTSELCQEQPQTEETRPCDRHMQNKAVAEKYCTKLMSHLFAECNLEVDPEPYYRDCLYDMCSCETKLDGCLCPVVAAYGQECAVKGILVDWRAEIRECGIQCTGGQKYQLCGNSCSRTCLDVATNPDCTKKCVEGCNCPEGFSLDGSGICVPITDCPCVYDAKEFRAGHVMMQQQDDGSNLVCECYKAGWNCRVPWNNETVTEPPLVECRQESHEVYDDCPPRDENTCKTLHQRATVSESCNPGCVCAAGYVRAARGGACIRHTQCPCHHGGRFYEEKAAITEDCNTCTCEGGLWQCTQRQCPEICTAWGESHYKTFDGRLYEFHGTCDYLLAKGSTSKADTFEVIIQNVPCGTDSITCAKSLTLRVGAREDQEVIEFSRNKPAPTKNMTRTIIREAGLFVFAEVTDMGLVLQWDRGTRAYLRLDPIWQGKVQGLCGNYNGDEQDDFQTPSKGSSEASVKIFGDSWRLQNYCPESILIQDTCSLHPHRRGWAAEQCDVLKSETFAPCHSEVPVEPYEERCQYDACGCNTGGDCHCLCTAVAAYAHECNLHGVYIRWRKPDFCPMQCDETCEHYEPCIPTCPLESCDTLFEPTSPVCAQDACVEGCAKDVCPPGQVYKNATGLECVPKADCEKKCLEIDGAVYMEGDIMSRDECHTCICSRKKKICRGTPCRTTTTPTILPTTLWVTTPSSPVTPGVTTPSSPVTPWVTTPSSPVTPWVTTPSSPVTPWVTTPLTSTTEKFILGDCRDGWSEWISEDKPIVLIKNSDTERVPQGIMKEGNKGFCLRSQIVDIRCRDVRSHRPHTEQAGVTCTLEEGLLCQGRNDATGADACWDYEVSFLCDCKCPLGQRPERRAVRCNHVCHSYRHFLQLSGTCLHDSQYAPACVDSESGVRCPGNLHLRDQATCVAKQDCNCYHRNGIFVPPGQATRVGECETCQCVDNDLRCDSSSCITAPTTLETSTFGCDEWSSWMSGGKPSSGNEWELLSDLRIMYPELCPVPIGIECRVKESHETAEEAGQVVTCDPQHGFQCLRSRNPQGCKDYEVRFLCECHETQVTSVEPTTQTTSTSYGTTTELGPNDTPTPELVCPPKTTFKQCAMPCDRICLFYYTNIRRHGECLLNANCAPGCVTEGRSTTCPAGFFMYDEARCVAVADCNCRLPDGQALPAGKWNFTSRCERCMCQNNHLLCSRVEGCEERTTETVTHVTKIPTMITPGLQTTTTPSPGRCNDWSPYYKNEKDSEGVVLSLDTLRTRNDFVCDNPVNATCREAATKVTAADLGQYLVCDAVEGLRCLNQENDLDCYNYEISFFCECKETTPTSTITITMGTTSSVAPCDSWSPWINDNRPWLADGDSEWRTLQQLQEDHQFCLEGQLVDIECVEAATGLNTAEENGTFCNVELGYQCMNADQVQESCLDYKIRYYCSCQITTTVTTTVIPHTPTSAGVCDPDKYINLLQEVEDSDFSSTPARNSKFGPSNARLYDKDGSLTSGSWAPAASDQDQFVQVDLGSVVPVFGVEVAGDPITRERVFSFTIQFSQDNTIWSVLPADLKNPTGPPKVFRGPINPIEPITQMFSEPIEMRYLRFKPTAWFQAIALRFEVIGCALPTVTPQTIPTTVKQPVCEEPMGLEGGMMSDLQIVVSSVLNDQDYFYGKQNIRLNTKSTPFLPAGAWVAEPKLNQFVRFDFLEPSKVSGVITQGRDNADEWVESFTVRYSPDGQTWNTIKNPDGSDRVFPGNFDRNTPVETKFDRVIQARYLEIRPKTWNSNIAMRVEVLGCFHPYPEVTTEMGETTTTTAPLVTTQPPQWNCSVCPGLPKEYYATCVPCSYREYYDGQSCVNEDRCPCFVDGVKYQLGSVFETRDCEECRCVEGGETECDKKECSQCEDEEQAILTPLCACVCKPCPEGTKLCPSSNYCLNESSWCNGVEECPDDELDCVTGMTEPPITVTPPGVTEGPRKITECILKGKSFTSFDGSKYTLETCQHILAQDMINKEWTVSVHTSCFKTEKCDRYLNISQEGKQLLLQHDLSIIWNGNIYNVTQAQYIGSSTNSFDISQARSVIHFKSRKHSYRVSWNTEMTVWIRVQDNLLGKVDGLCGFYTENSTDDFLKPDGTLAVNIKEFGQAWALDGETCEERPRCKSEVSNIAVKLCNNSQFEPLNKCHSTVNPASYMNGCIDNICKCLSDKDVEECRCQAIKNYVTQCLEKNPAAPISDWHVASKCYKTCGPGEVYHDCYRATCEKTCETLHGGPQCSDEKGSCVSGCFCSPGLVRKGEQCVVPERCRDCVCKGYGDPHYVTFDRYNYTFNGECSYVAARDKNPQNQHEFQVIISNKQCTVEPVTVCTDAITIHYDTHLVVISTVGEAIRVTVDNDEVPSFPHREPWLALEQQDSSQVMAVIPDIQLEVTFFLENHEFSIRIPSHLFFNKTEGLCGNCNYNDEDELMAKSTGLVESVNTFGLSWLLDNETGTCGVLDKEIESCIPLPPDQDPCLAIMNEDIFGKCHPVEDPVNYVSSCQLDACHSPEPLVSACHSLEAYARRCADLDICLDWRSEKLCPKACSGGKEYRACKSGCVHTCDNHDELENNPDACPMSAVDGCFCPDGMVLHKGTCVSASYCKTCDKEGHHVGDVWQIDNCTTCECTDLGTTCNTHTCPDDPICDEGYIVVEVPEYGDVCCGPKKKCEVSPPKACPPAEKKDECRYGQRQKLIKAPGVCPQYACVCLEPDDCPEPAIPDDVDLEPGEEWTLDVTGCCAIFIKQCAEECPEATCPLFHIKKEEMSKGDCCPKTKCRPPGDACIYEHQYPLGPSGVKLPVDVSVAPEIRLYKVNESWADGLCLTCKCVLDEQGQPRHECTQQTCLTVDTHPDAELFLLETVLSPGRCCAEIVRTACIDDDTVIEVGDHLNDTLNGCRSVKCIKNTKGKVDKMEKILSCDETCPAGWEYEPSPLYPQQCCGKCVQVACVVAGQVKAVDETWLSDDLCTAYTCSRDQQDQIQIQAVETKCSEPSEEELNLYVYEESRVPYQCCLVYTRVACKLNGTSVPVGESIQDPLDSCATISCSADAAGNITRHEKETVCDKHCGLGSTYMEPSSSSECCGKCLKTECTEDGKTYALGERWENEDVCYEYICETRNGVLTTVASKKECPYFNPECPEEETYMDELGCCKLCSITRPEGKCQPEVMPLQETVGIFQLSSHHVGTCQNSDPVPDFRQCFGHCDSYTSFQSQGEHASHVSTCFCCKPSRFEKIQVLLQCDSGNTVNPVYNNIAECECLKCSDDTSEYKGSEPVLDKFDYFDEGNEPIKE